MCLRKHQQQKQVEIPILTFLKGLVEGAIDNERFFEENPSTVLTGAYIKLAIEDFSIGHDLYIKEIESTSNISAHQGIYYGLADFTTNKAIFYYTTGEAIEKLRPMMDEVVSSWEKYARVFRLVTNEPDNTIFLFGDRTSYNIIIQLVGLAILLRREDLLPRLDALNPGYQGVDAIYEELLKPYLPNRPYTDTWYHDWPYEDVLDAIDSKDPKEQSELMGEAVEDWYAANEGVPFHDTHKNLEESLSATYFGYWCFELAALCYIFNIDDSRFRDHITYPKDLVDFARKSGNPTSLSFASAALAQGESLRVEAGQPCPREGYYFTPAKVDSRKLFKQGEIMPEVGSDYGATIWQLDNNQDK